MGRKWGSRGEPVAVRLPARLLSRVDELVREGKFRSRTEVFNEAVMLLLQRTVWNWNFKGWVEKVHIDDKNDVIISVRLSKHYMKYIDELVFAGAFSNRSEAIKTALMQFMAGDES